MIRTAVGEKLGGEKNFRWRGSEVSRTENLSDAVFGFAITLLVVSLEVPRSFAELRLLLQDFVPFGACVAVMGIIWHAHYKFFRRYGLNDGATMIINTVLLFFVVFYLYPLKFLATMLYGLIATGSLPDATMTRDEGNSLLLIYSAGYAAVFAALSAFYFQAWRRRETLQLTEVERLMTLQSAWLLIVHVVSAALAVGAMLLTGSALSGLLYFSIAPLSFVVGFTYGRRIERAAARLSSWSDPSGRGSA